MSPDDRAKKLLAQIEEIAGFTPPRVKADVLDLIADEIQEAIDEAIYEAEREE